MNYYLVRGSPPSEVAALRFQESLRLWRVCGKSGVTPVGAAASMHLPRSFSVAAGQQVKAAAVRMPFQAGSGCESKQRQEVGGIADLPLLVGQRLDLKLFR
jgi:hypothetical protein